MLRPQPGEWHLDGTFGAGGYTQAILAAADTRVLAIDRDPDAVRAGAAIVAAAGGRLTLVQERFGDLERVAVQALPPDVRGFDGVVLDIGVSSMQIDAGERGFSFRLDGPLDMRMERSGPSAGDLVNQTDETTLADILYRYGEERASRRIARAVVADRKAVPFTTTRALADLIARVAPAPPNAPHAATRSFQALRIAVNDELGELVRALEGAARVLNEGGRLVVVTFHSLEDRIVKQFLASASGKGAVGSRHRPDEAASPAQFIVPGRQPTVPAADEVAGNPRARSAKLRHAIRTAAPALPAPAAVRALAELPSRASSAHRGKR